MAAAYVIRKTSNSQYYFNLRADNNEVILTSETYVAKWGAQNGIASCRTNSPIDSRYDRKRSIDNQYYFVLKAGNGEVIGKSETYSSQSAMEGGIGACKRLGPSAPVEDLA